MLETPSGTRRTLAVRCCAVGIRAGDILLATLRRWAQCAQCHPRTDRIARAAGRDRVRASVKCRVEMEAHLTLAARDSLQLAAGTEVWLVIKTHSCHLMQS